VGQGPIKVTAIRDPAQLPHKLDGVDIALECTGLFTSRDKAAAHLAAGARKVLVSAPCEGADKTVVFGVNHQSLGAGDLVVSNGSCTTNCLAVVARVLLDTCGIERGYMTTIHSYTSDQPTHDTLHPDMYRARAAAMSMVPTSTGAAKALGLVLPELTGKLDGSSIRVPTPNVSAVDLKIVPGREVTREEINQAMSEAAAKGPLRGILDVTNDAVVSTDMNHVDASATVALPQTQVIDGALARVLAWYDNEWAFSTRMADVALVMARLA
jgi:glyceraldehyde 3-phosphate dehydrogenase